MNSENNNVENLEPESLGSFEIPTNQNLNNDVTADNGTIPMQDSVQPTMGFEPINQFDNVQQPIEQLDELNVTPQQPLENIADLNVNQTVPENLNSQAEVQTAVNDVPNQNLDPVNNFDNLNMMQGEPKVDYTQPIDVVGGPTQPIPDVMPSIDYQSTTSTPLDYATPSSDFGEIGTTPEIDPKTIKSKNKGFNKILLFILIIVLIGGLGYGSYYLINVKGILNTSSVNTKSLKFELGENLPTDIKEYATFNKTSASNCTLTNNEVDILKVGTYKYTIKCGEDSYTGNIEIVDTKAPYATSTIAVATVGADLKVEDLNLNCSELKCSYEFAKPENLSQELSSVGLKNIEINVTDEAGNKSVSSVPVMVLKENFRMSYVLSKKLTDVNIGYDAEIKEINLIITGEQTFSGEIESFYEIKLSSFEDYQKIQSSYNGNTLEIGSLKGIPVFDPNSNRILLASIGDTTLVTSNSAYATMQNYIAQGYTVLSTISAYGFENIFN